MQKSLDQKQFNPVLQDESNNHQQDDGPVQIDNLNISMNEDKISPENDRFPYCIVWTALPFITWIIPFIGHTGIALSNGVIHDFAGPYYISVDNFAFGKPLNIISFGNLFIWKFQLCYFKTQQRPILQMKLLFNSNNCHSHVADALNNMGYMGKTNWNMVSVWFICIWSSKYVSWWKLILTYLPLTIMLLIGFLLGLFS